MKYKRILLKLSGESLMGSGDYGIDPEKIRLYAEEIRQACDRGLELGIVIGGGNIFRGIAGKEKGIDRVQADHMGMLATCINGLALQSALEAVGVDTRLLTGIKMERIAEPYIKRRAIRHLEKGRVVIFSAGTGNPFFTTDTAATLRGAEIGADVVLKGTRVDGIYDKDPEKNDNAIRFDKISYDEVLGMGLRVMDMTAISFCAENKLPIIVFDMDTSGNLLKIVNGANVGTRVE